jgi:hypothetical protein
MLAGLPGDREVHQHVAGLFLEQLVGVEAAAGPGLLKVRSVHYVPQLGQSTAHHRPTSPRADTAGDGHRRNGRDLLRQFGPAHPMTGSFRYRA